MAWLDPQPRDEGPCRCAECFGLVEMMERVTGKDYYALAGVPRPRPLHTRPPVQELPPEPVEEPVDITPRRAVRQPWEPRPARKREAA